MLWTRSGGRLACSCQPYSESQHFVALCLNALDANGLIKPAARRCATLRRHLFAKEAEGASLSVEDTLFENPASDTFKTEQL